MPARELSKRDEAWLTYATLLGVEFAYNDYGHPERAGHRKYWRAYRDGKDCGCGRTQAEAAGSALYHLGYYTDRNLTLQDR